MFSASLDSSDKVIPKSREKIFTASLDRSELNERSDEVRTRFEENKSRYIKDLRPLLVELSQDGKEEFTEDKIAEGKIEEEPELKIYYFIGRLNPPHNGHIEGLRQLIQASGDNGKVLILLGSGPKGIKTMNDPIDFELKQHIIIEKLKPYFEPDFIDKKIRNGDIQILEMDTAAAQIASASEKMIEPLHKTVTITRFSGDKDGDVEKLKYVDNSAVQRIQGQHENMEVSSTVVSVPPISASASGTEMSATAVRKDAYQAYLEDRNQKLDRDRGRENFYSKYNDFYGDNVRNIYEAIIAPAKELTDAQIQMYINSTRILTDKVARQRLDKILTEKGGRLIKRTRKNKKLRITRRRKSRRNKKISRKYKHKHKHKIFS